jgi:hypothetical protein
VEGQAMSGAAFFEYIHLWTPLLAEIQDLLRLFPFVFIALVVGGLIWLQIHKAKKRQEGMQKAASELGLAYQAVQPGEFDGRLAKFNLMCTGSSRQTNNFIVASTEELNLVLFDYRYTTGSGKNRRVHYQTVAWITSQQLVLPQFYISPESWLSRIGDFFVRQDIDIPQDPEFSKAFVLSGPDADQIRQFFNAKRREALLKVSLPTIECFPGELLFYRSGRLTPPEQLKALMNEAFALYQAFATIPP